VAHITVGRVTAHIVNTLPESRIPKSTVKTFVLAVQTKILTILPLWVKGHLTLTSGLRLELNFLVDVKVAGGRKEVSKDPSTIPPPPPSLELAHSKNTTWKVKVKKR